MYIIPGSDRLESRTDGLLMPAVPVNSRNIADRPMVTCSGMLTGQNQTSGLDGHHRLSEPALGRAGTRQAPTQTRTGLWCLSGLFLLACSADVGQNSRTLDSKPVREGNKIK